MVWLSYLVIAIVVTAFLTKFKNFKQLWIIGLTTILFLYIIDSTLVSLGAYSLYESNSILSGIPVFYLLAGFPGGILLAYFYPSNKALQLPYILFAAAIFLVLEIIMKWLGYINYINWNLIKSYILNVVGFMALMWLGQWLGAVGKGEKFK